MIRQNGGGGVDSSGNRRGGQSGSGAATVLVVDDDPEIRDVLELVLKCVGYVVETAANGDEALQSMQSHGRPQVALVDVQMPVMNGWELLRVMANDDEACQGSRRDHLRPPERGRPASVAEDRFMQEPVDVDELLAVARKYTRRTRQGGFQDAFQPAPRSLEPEPPDRR